MPSQKVTKKVKHSRKFIKFKLLLDEGLSFPNKYPTLNKNYDLKHIISDYKFLRGKEDEQVYKVATKENRLMVVFNTKDFRPLIKKEGASIVLLSNKLSNKDADLRICKMLKELYLKQSKGWLININNTSTSLKLPE